MAILSCDHEPSEHGEHTTGTAHTSDGREICWSCAAEEEKQTMRETGKATLYFVRKPDRTDFGGQRSHDRVQNWTGYIDFPLAFGNRFASESRHNFAGVRYDFYFCFEGFVWHGFTVGKNTQIAHCKRTKTHWDEQKQQWVT